MICNNLFKKEFALVSCLVATLPGLSFAEGSGGVDDFGMEDHSAICDYKANIQTLSEADFNGNGVVDDDDEMLVQAAVDLYESTGKYTSFYDINDDGKLSKKDVKKTHAKLGKASSELDQQIAALYNNIKQYEDINTAIAHDFIPFTQEYQSHGIHMIKFLPDEANVLDDIFEFDKPEGLNYDRHGNLVGVFYYYGPNVATMMQGDAEAQAEFAKWMGPDAPGKPAGFVDDKKGNMQDHWHFHKNVCSRNLMAPYPDATNVPVTQLSYGLWQQATTTGDVTYQQVFNVAEQLEVRQCDLQAECMGDGGIFIPRFYMLHAWLFNRNNRCGIFWGTHEDVSVNDLLEGQNGDLIPSERQSFILQAEGDYLLDENGMEEVDENGDPIENKHYREICLDPDVTGYFNSNGEVNTYESVRQLISENEDMKQTLLCPPGQDRENVEGCDRQLVKDLGETGLGF
jgi:hypothetical protein